MHHQHARMSFSGTGIKLSMADAYRYSTASVCVHADGLASLPLRINVPGPWAAARCERGSKQKKTTGSMSFFFRPTSGKRGTCRASTSRRRTPWIGCMVPSFFKGFPSRAALGNCWPMAMPLCGYAGGRWQRAPPCPTANRPRHQLQSRRPGTPGPLTSTAPRPSLVTTCMPSCAFHAAINVFPPLFIERSRNSINAAIGVFFCLLRGIEMSTFLFTSTRHIYMCVATCYGCIGIR